MKICHITSVHPYKDTRIFLKECSSLSFNGYATHLIAPSAPNEKINRVQVHGIEKEKGSRFKRMTKTVNQVYRKALEIDADLYHFHDPELIPTGLKLKKARKKVIYDVHEDVPRQILSKHWIKKSIRSSISWSFEKYENYAAKKFDGVVTATPFINERFLKLGCNAINVNNYPILSELHIPEVDWEKKERVVCYVGGIGAIRGLFEMVEAMSKTTRITLLFGGAFTTTKDEELVKKTSGWDRIKEFGVINRQQVSETFARSMAGLVLFHPLPNHIDAQPNKMFEYMSAGLPVIASNFPLWKEIIEGNRCGLCVNPLNTDEIASAIQWVVDHPKEARRMGENGRKAIEEKYNWETESKKLLQLYKELETK